MKIAVIFSVLFILTVLLVVISNRGRIYVTIISLFFPIIIPFMGRDALSTGTVCIFIVYLIYLLESCKERNIIKEKYDLWVYLLIIFAGVSITSAGILKTEELGASLRLYVSFFGAMLFFLVTKNYQDDDFQSESKSHIDHIEKIISLILLLVTFHVMISISVMLFPITGYAFNFFLPRDHNIFEIPLNSEVRIYSFIFEYEGYGEILAMLSPIILYKVFKFKNLIWIFCLLVFSIGEMLSVTRSGILLFILGIIISFIYNFRKYVTRTFSLAFILLTFLVVIGYWSPSVFTAVILRFNDAYETHLSTTNIFETINRGNFPDIWDYVTSNLTLFGKGMVRVDFHNLFFTTLYQMGIIGTVLFFAVFLYPLVRLIKSFKNQPHHIKPLSFACILSIVLFLINETKFEFTRHDSYQQICWGLIGTYYLVSKIPLLKKSAATFEK